MIINTTWQLLDTSIISMKDSHLCRFAKMKDFLIDSSWNQNIKNTNDWFAWFKKNGLKVMRMGNTEKSEQGKRWTKNKEDRVIAANEQSSNIYSQQT